MRETEDFESDSVPLVLFLKEHLSTAYAPSMQRVNISPQFPYRAFYGFQSEGGKDLVFATSSSSGPIVLSRTLTLLPASNLNQLTSCHFAGFGEAPGLVGREFVRGIQNKRLTTVQSWVDVIGPQLPEDVREWVFSSCVQAFPGLHLPTKRKPKRKAA